MKTYQEWVQGNLHLDNFLTSGDEVDEAMVNYFRNSCQLRTIKYDLIQLGKPYEHYRNEKRKIQGAYATLKLTAGKWFYAGVCFKGESIPARQNIFVILESQNSDMGFRYYRNVCNPDIWYLTDRSGQWSSLCMDGNPDGPLRAGIRIHIMNELHLEISQETTNGWKA